MPRKSAFSKTSRPLDDLVHLDPVQKQLVTIATVGLKRTFSQIKNGERINISYDSSKTDCKGRYRAVIGEILVNRYKIIGLFSTHGQSAVIVKAVLFISFSDKLDALVIEDYDSREDLFMKEQVVVKILHVGYYKIGIQETHCLTRLASADPYHISHTVKLKASYRYGKHFCMVFETLQPEPITNHFINRSWSEEKRLRDIRRLSFKILQILSFLKQQNTIHADLKPENILLQEVDDILSMKVIDFGNAIHHVHKDVALYYQTFELQTLLYRAPEVMFGIPFGSEIDVWSLGCILAELYLGKPLFFGRNKQQMLKQISSLLGPFPCDLFKKGKFYDENVEFVGNCVQEDASQVLLQHMTGCCDYMFANFLSELLRYDPDQRLSPLEALQHPFLGAEFHVGVHLCPKVTKESAFTLKAKNYEKRPHISSQIRRQNPNTYDLLSLGTSSLKDSFDNVAVVSLVSTRRNANEPLPALVRPIGRVSEKNISRTRDKRSVRGPLLIDGRGVIESSLRDGGGSLLADERGSRACNIEKCSSGPLFADERGFRIPFRKSRSNNCNSDLNGNEFENYTDDYQFDHIPSNYDSKQRHVRCQNCLCVDNQDEEFSDSGERLNRGKKLQKRRDIDSLSSVSQSSNPGEGQDYQEYGFLEGQRASTEQQNKIRLNKCRYPEKRRDIDSISSVSQSCSSVDGQEQQKCGFLENQSASAEQVSKKRIELATENSEKLFMHCDEFNNSNFRSSYSSKASVVHKNQSQNKKLPTDVYFQEALLGSPPGCTTKSSSSHESDTNFTENIKVDGNVKSFNSLGDAERDSLSNFRSPPKNMDSAENYSDAMSSKVIGNKISRSSTCARHYENISCIKNHENSRSDLPKRSDIPENRSFVQIIKTKTLDQDLKKSEYRSPRRHFPDSSNAESIKLESPINRTSSCSRKSTPMEAVNPPASHFEYSPPLRLATTNVESRSHPKCHVDECSDSRSRYKLTSPIQEKDENQTLSSQYQIDRFSGSRSGNKIRSSPMQEKVYHQRQSPQYVISARSGSRTKNMIGNTVEELDADRKPKTQCPGLCDSKSENMEIGQMQEREVNETYIILNEKFNHPSTKIESVPRYVIEEPVLKTEKLSNILHSGDCTFVDGYEPSDSCSTFRGLSSVEVQNDLKVEVKSDELPKSPKSSAGSRKQPKSAECKEYIRKTRVKSKNSSSQMKKMSSKCCSKSDKKRVGLDSRNSQRTVKVKQGRLEGTRRQNTIIHQRKNALYESLYYEEESSDRLLAESSGKKHLKENVKTKSKCVRNTSTYVSDREDHYEEPLCNHLISDLKKPVFKRTRNVHADGEDDQAKSSRKPVPKRKRTVSSNVSENDEVEKAEHFVKNIKKASSRLRNDRSDVSIMFNLSNDEEGYDVHEEISYAEPEAKVPISLKASPMSVSEGNMITIQSSTFGSTIHRPRNHVSAKHKEAGHVQCLQTQKSASFDKEPLRLPRSLRKRKNPEEFLNDPNYITYGKCVYYARNLYKKKS